MQFTMDFVEPSGVPMLIGLDIMDKYKLVPDNVDNLLINKQFQWAVPNTRKRGHLYLEWIIHEVFYTKGEILRIHKHFFHPSATKLFEVIARAKPH